MNKTEKERNLIYIKGFSKIKIKDICKKLNIDSSNLWNGRCSEEKVKMVRQYIENELDKIKDVKNAKNSSL